MLAMPDVEREGWCWIDRGIDGRADRFLPCPTCQELLSGSDMASGWQPAALCPDCGSRLEIESAVAAVKEERPLIWRTDPNHRMLNGGLIPIWSPPPIDLTGPHAEGPEYPGYCERIP